MATDPGTGAVIGGLGGLMQADAQAKQASASNKLHKRHVDLEETQLRDKGEIANLLLDFINSSGALNPDQAKAQENQILRTDSKRDQDFMSGTQSLPGGGNPNDTVNAENRARLLAAQQDLQIRRNRQLDMELLNARFQALLATASLGGIRSPKTTPEMGAVNRNFDPRTRRLRPEDDDFKYLNRTA